MNHKAIASIAVLAAFAASPSFATNEQGNGSVHHNTTVNSTGGQGGAGGNAYSTSGVVVKNGNTNNVTSKNTQTQAQAQKQSNRQTQSTASSAQGGKASAVSGPSSSSVHESNNASQAVRVDSPDVPVSTAYAPNISPTAVCSGAAGIGATGRSFGFSFGTSFTEENCMLLEQVRIVSTTLGDRAAAEELMCGVERYREARARMGRPCLVDSQPKDQKVMNSTYDEKDPFIRRRLGLPPL